MDSAPTVEVIPIIRRVLRVTGMCRDAIVAEYMKHSEAEPLLCHHVHQLGAFFSDRTSAIFMLIQDGLLWDAEIILRSAAEAAMKLSVVCLESPTEREKLLVEYWDALSDIASLKRSERARTRLTSHDANEPDRFIFEELCLTPDEERVIRDRWPREVRREIEQRWSFMELLARLDALTRASGQFGRFSALRHGYGISSHLAHADESGVGMPIDRKSRNPQVRSAMIDAHAARLISDCLSFWLLITTAVRTAFAASWPQAEQIVRSATELLAALEPFENAFYSTLLASRRTSRPG